MAGQVGSGSSTVNVGETEVLLPGNGSKLMVVPNIPFYHRLGFASSGFDHRGPAYQPGNHRVLLTDKHFMEVISICYR